MDKYSKSKNEIQSHKIVLASKNSYQHKLNSEKQFTVIHLRNESKVKCPRNFFLEFLLRMFAFQGVCSIFALHF